MQKVHDGLRFLFRTLSATLAFSAVHGAATAAFHPLDRLSHPFQQRSPQCCSRARQSFPDTQDLLSGIASIAPGKHGIHRGSLQILMLPAKHMDGCVPSKNVRPKEFQLFVHAAASRFLSNARSRFWRSVSRAVSFS